MSTHPGETREFHRRLNSPSPGFDAWMERAFTRQATWKRCFAWFPVVIDGKRVWLKMVERRVPSHYDCYLQGWRPIDEPKSVYRLPTNDGELEGPTWHSEFCEHADWRTP